MKIKIFLIYLFLSITINAQKKQLIKPRPKASTIENHFIYTYNYAGDYKEFKMIKRSNYKKFQKSVLDSVSLLKKNITVKVANLKKKQTKIETLDTTISNLENQLKGIEGDETNNENLKMVLFGVIGTLVLALMLFIFKFKRSSVVTTSTKINLNEIEDEFEKYRKKTLENEQKLRRQLQDEINKQRGV